MDLTPTASVCLSWEFSHHHHKVHCVRTSIDGWEVEWLVDWLFQSLNKLWALVMLDDVAICFLLFFWEAFPTIFANSTTVIFKLMYKSLKVFIANPDDAFVSMFVCVGASVRMCVCGCACACVKGMQCSSWTYAEGPLMHNILLSIHNEALIHRETLMLGAQYRTMRLLATLDCFPLSLLEQKGQG